MSCFLVIPARYGSTRFPGKALAALAGRPLVQHVYERARRSKAAAVIVATDDERIAAAARGFGAEVEMTATGHASGTDRVAEVAARRGWPDDAVVVNVQGDVPLVRPEDIDALPALLAAQPGADIATLCTPITGPGEFVDPNVVKVVMDSADRALYFSRAALPAAGHGSDPAPPGGLAWRHIGLYAYRVDALRRLSAAQPCDLELRERLEQLRAMWLGMEIRLARAAGAPGPDIDTPQDLAAAEAYLRHHEHEHES